MNEPCGIAPFIVSHFEVSLLIFTRRLMHWNHRIIVGALLVNWPMWSTLLKPLQRLRKVSWSTNLIDGCMPVVQHVQQSMGEKELFYVHPCWGSFFSLMETNVHWPTISFMFSRYLFAMSMLVWQRVLVVGPLDMRDTLVDFWISGSELSWLRSFKLHMMEKRWVQPNPKEPRSWAFPQPSLLWGYTSQVNT